MKALRYLSLLLVGLLAGRPAARAFLGDDFATVETRYGAALVRQQLAPGSDITVHETLGYRVVVLYRDGRSQRETFAKLAGPFDFTEAEIGGFLKAHANAQPWDQTAATNSVQSWERPGAAAFYLVNADKTNLAFERLDTVAPAIGSSDDSGKPGKPPEKGLTTGKLGLGKLELGKLPTGKLQTGGLTTGPLGIGRLQTGSLFIGKLEGAATSPTSPPDPAQALVKPTPAENPP